MSGEEPATEHNEDEPVLIYDGECPVCTAYSRSAKVDAAAGKALRRVNARSDDALVREAEAAGLDLDEGMVLVHGGQRYHGAEALHRMAQLAPNKGLRNRINKLMFGNRAVSRLSYPLLRAGRNALLKLLGRKKIRTMRQSQGGAPRGSSSR